MIRVLLVDDHPVVRAGLAAVIAAAPDITISAEADGAHTALEMLRVHDVDLIVSDLQMPHGDGIDLIRALPDGPPVLILKTFDTQAHVVRAVEAGAVGYLLKDAPPAELLHSIRQAAEGRTVFSYAVASALAERTRGPGQALSEREEEILRLVALGRTNADIAAELFISLATVKTHMSRIFDKLGADNRTAAVERARRLGVLD